MNEFLGKSKAWIKKHKYDIQDGLFLAGCFAVGGVVGWFGTKYVYEVGGVDKVNQLLLEGKIQWTDGMPVTDTDGNLISGDPDWTIADSKVGLRRSVL